METKALNRKEFKIVQKQNRKNKDTVCTPDGSGGGTDGWRETIQGFKWLAGRGWGGKAYLNQMFVFQQARGGSKV